MDIYFQNTATRKKEKFESLQAGKVGIYTCGPTVYNYVHIGNLRTFIFEDLLVRFLRYMGYDVMHVMNLTDVDDKTIRGSLAEKIPLQDFTERYKKAFFEDINALNLAPAQVYPAATEHIQEMVDMITTLLDKGYAYRADDGSVYFSISRYASYGGLSGIKQDNMLENASGRIATDEYSKEEARDFVLWKAWSEADGEVFWETSLGKGRPGWHIECSAMGMKYLGAEFDIHCGGIDNMFPHHENEIAQSEAATGKKFVNYWLHSAFLTIDSEKMAKSKGNFYTLRDLLALGHDPLAIRYALLATHYRQPLSFSFDLIAQSQAAGRRVKEFVSNMSQIKKKNASGKIEALINEARDNFKKHLADDLNISPALASIFDFIRQANSLSTELSDAEGKAAAAFIAEVDQVLGLFPFKEAILEEEILALIAQREEARALKDFKKSDDIRDYLLTQGIKIKDSKEGTVWEKI